MYKLQCTDTITKYSTVPQAMERYKISRKTLMKYADDAGAVIRFGKSVRIDVDKLDSYISNTETR